MAAIISDKIKRQFLTQLFDEATGTKLGDSDNYFYMAVGRSQSWDAVVGNSSPGTTDVATSPTNSEREEHQFRYGVQAVKAVEAFSFVIPIKDWTANSQYQQYNDNSIGHPSTSYYVRTADNNIYVCIRTGKNGDGDVQVSTVKPDHTDTSLPIESDGYIWKYLYTISTADTNSFVTSNYMPVKYVDSAISTDLYYVQYTIQNAAVPGQIIGYRVTNGGQDYSDTDTLTVIGDGSGATARLIQSAGAITAVEIGDSANVGASGYPTITSAMGAGYSRANIRITTTAGSSASIVPIFAHSNGLGADPREDLRSTAMMYHIKPEGNVSNDWVTGNDYRQVALWKNPTDSAGQKFTGTSGTAAGKLTLTSVVSDGVTFNGNMRITGDSNANAWIDFISDSNIWYHQDEYTGFTSFRSAEPVSIGNDNYIIDLHNVAPDVDRYSGDILFVSNDAAVSRSTEGTDDIKLVIQL